MNERNEDVVDLILFLNQVITSDRNTLDQRSRELCDFFIKHFICNLDDGLDIHFQISVYSYINPTMGPQFLLHIMLSMARFNTERELLPQPSMRDKLREAK